MLGLTVPGEGFGHGKGLAAMYAEAGVGCQNAVDSGLAQPTGTAQNQDGLHLKHSGSR
jgi:hypothetical protein